MATINVKDAAGATVALEKPLAPGAAAAASSRPVAIATDQFVTEDAAAAADPVGAVLMAVRRDTLSTSEVSADGDNIALKATNKGKLHVAAELRFGDMLADTGSGTGGSATQRVILDSTQFQALGTAAKANATAVSLATDQPVIAVASDTSKIGNGDANTLLTPKFAKITASSSGATTIVAAVTSKKIRVLAWDTTVNAAVNFKWQSHVTPTDLTGLYYTGGQGGGVARSFNPIGYFETVAGEALDINLSSAVAVGGCLTYVEV